MTHIGQAVAFAAFVLSAAWLEVGGKDAQGLWIVAIIWVLCADWAPTVRRTDAERAPK